VTAAGCVGTQVGGEIGGSGLAKGRFPREA